MTSASRPLHGGISAAGEVAKDTRKLVVEVVGQSITAIIDSVGKVKGLISEVSEASQQQTQGIQQVAEAIAQMEKVTQSTAANAEESAAASEELNGQAETTMGDVMRLEGMVVGSRAGAPVTRAHVAPPSASSGGRKVLAHAPKGQRPKGISAEDQLPLNDTGTFGKFQPAPYDHATNDRSASASVIDAGVAGISP